MCFLRFLSSRNAVVVAILYNHDTSSASVVPLKPFAAKNALTNVSCNASSLISCCTNIRRICQYRRSLYRAIIASNVPVPHSDDFRASIICDTSLSIFCKRFQLLETDYGKRLKFRCENFSSILKEKITSLSLIFREIYATCHRLWYYNITTLSHPYG